MSALFQSMDLFLGSAIVVSPAMREETVSSRTPY
jgi:hypothetical protein